MNRTKKSVLCALLCMSLMLLFVYFTASAETATPGEGMTFEQATVCETTANYDVNEQLTMETEFWFDPSGDERAGTLIGNYSDGKNPGKRYSLEMYYSGKIRFYTSGDNTNPFLFSYDVRPHLEDGKFVKIAVVVDMADCLDPDGNAKTGKATLYVNGEEKETKYTATESLAPGWFSTNTPLCIGGDRRSKPNCNEYYFKGEIKNVTVYSDVRTPSEISSSAKSLTYSPDVTDDALLMAFDLTSKTPFEDLSKNKNNIKTSTPNGYTPQGNPTLSLERNLSETPSTYEAMIFCPTDASGVIFGNRTTSDQPCINFEITQSGEPSLYIKNSSTEYVSATFTTTGSNVRKGSWVHLVIVHDSGEFRCYVDGEHVGSIAQSFDTDIAAVQSASAIAVGRDKRSGNEYKGFIKRIALYDRPLSAEEVSNAYNNGVDTGEDSLILYYDLANGATKSRINDLSGNENHASTGYFQRETSKTDYAYSFAVVGDTQRQVWSDYLSRIDNNPSNDTYYTENLYKWIVDNKDKKNIKWVFGVGDITEKNGNPNNESSPYEWELAKEAILQLDDADIDYSLIIGNHDRIPELNTYFAPQDDDFYTKRVTGYYEEGSLGNYYINFEVADVKYMVLCLEYGPSNTILNWASEVVEAHPERRVIVTTHAYMYRDGTTLDKDDVTPPNPNGYTVYDSDRNNGDMMWEKFVSKHRNILMVLSGHDPCENIVFRQDRGEYGNLVSQFLVDPQKMSANLGMICMLYFSEDGKDVSVEWISTAKSQELQKDDADAEDVLYKAFNQFDFTMYDNYNNFIYDAELIEIDEKQSVYRIYYTNGTCHELVINHGNDGANGANGNDGADGASVSVKSVEKTASEGLVDIYTITFSDNSTATFTITNGKDGENGNDGAPGSNGDTPYIGENGNWFIGNIDTGIESQGDKGETGATGAQGPQGEQGEQGVPGEIGPQGEANKTGTVLVLSIIATVCSASSIALAVVLIFIIKKKRII